VGRGVYLEDCDGVLPLSVEARVCFVVLNATGPHIRVVCDRME